ncbi:MAG: PD40 domain-containing protein [Kiritimatiellae bacterium]|nr:PD40 domain-containing protein [Kiritimatiellia bacterium]
MKKSARWGMIVLLAAVAAGRAQDMPIGERVRRVESAHFVVYYQESLADRVPALVRECETAHAVLTPIFHWTPREKVQVLFHDGWDEHNGWAFTIPRARLSFFAAGPSPSSIYEPGGYLRSTIWHEYTHVLMLDAKHGFGDWLGRFFGRFLPEIGDPVSTLIFYFALPPGLTAPNWFLEGASIWSETEFTRQGRGRQSLPDMVMRMAVADGRALDARQWELAHPEWPYSDAAYLWGARAVQHAQEQRKGKKDRNVVGELSDSVSRSWPWFFDDRARPVTGQSFADLARRALDEETRYQQKQLATLREKPLTEVKKRTPDRLLVSQPKFSADGRSVFFAGNREAARDVLYRYDLDSGRIRPLKHARVQAGISRLAAAGERLYYTRLNILGRDRVFSELRVMDAASGRTRPVDAAGRYRFPAISPDGTKLAAVRNEAAVCRLVEVPLAAAGRRDRERVLAGAAPFTMIVDPAYSPDGKWLVFVQGREGESELRRVNLENGETETLLKWPCIVLGPAFHPDGKELVFSADRNGVYNLYRLPFRAGADPEPLTHVLGGLFEPAFSPDGKRLAATAYDSYGYGLAVLEYEALHPVEGALPSVRREWPAVADNQRRLKEAEEEAPELGPARPYRSLLETRLDYWTPWAVATEESAMGGLAARLSDPAGFQSLALLGGYDGEEEMPVGSAVYSYAGLYPVFTVFGLYSADSYPDLVRDTDGNRYDYEEKSGAAGLAVTVPWIRVDRELALTLGYRYLDREALESGETNYADRALLTTNLFEGSEAALFGQLEYFDGTAYPRSHSVEDGRYVSAGVEWTDRALGGDLDRVRGLLAWLEYFTLPWGENHVLKMDWVYGAGSGDETAQGFFGVGGLGDVVENSTPGLARTIALRGYEPNTQVGRQATRAITAWRFPLCRVYKGMSATKPVYRQQLFGELFWDIGKAWGGEPAGEPANDWLNSVGLELNFSMTLLRFLDVAPGLGFAYAFEREPSDERAQVYFSLKSAVSF